MATGVQSYEGLAVPLFGESTIQQQTAATDILTIEGASGMAADFIVCKNSAGTEIMYLRQDGFMRLNPTTTISAMGFDCRMNASSTTGVNVGGNFRLTMSGTGASAQSYALWAYLDVTSWTVGGGREAVLNLTYAGVSSASGSMRGFICFNGVKAQNLFNIPGGVIGEGCVKTLSSANSTHGIRITIGDTDTVYYILVTSCQD